MLRATALSAALAASQRLLARSDRNLVQSAATQTLAAQSLCQYGRLGACHQRVYRLLQPSCQTDQLDLYGRKAGTQTRKAFMIACTKFGMPATIDESKFSLPGIVYRALNCL